MEVVDPRICILCRGARYLCGKSYCPIVTKARIFSVVKPLESKTHLFGSSPPAVFVGRIGYPYVYLGPLVPPVSGDTSIYDLPEKWSDIPLEEVLSMRLSLVLPRDRVEVRDIDSRIVRLLHEIALSVKPIDLEVELAKPLKPSALLSDYEPPIGPRAPVKSIKIASSGSSYRVVERVYSDEDMKASEAVIELYTHGIPVSYIQKLFSIGALGKRRHRKLVPTRWAITAVDDIASRYLISKIKSFDELDRVEVFVRKVRKNLFIAILIPGKWSFEWMEAWFPRSTWNPFGREVVVEGDYELYMGRKDYPSIGGCYFASRLAIAEYLYRIRRQAIAIVLREIYPGFDIPVGVWFVREQVRAMLRSSPIVVDSVEEALAVLDRYSVLGAKRWIQESSLLRKILKEKKLLTYAVDKRG